MVKEKYDEASERKSSGIGSEGLTATAICQMLVSGADRTALGKMKGRNLEPAASSGEVHNDR